jgi:hypothetical protein
MLTEARTRAILKQIGNPADIDQGLERFRRAAKVLSAKHPRMIDLYDKKWIAVYQGKVVAQGKTFGSVMTQIDEKEFPREQVLVRFINKNQRTMIL